MEAVFRAGAIKDAKYNIQEEITFYDTNLSTSEYNVFFSLCKRF
jgi:hypothetical protein